LFALCYGNSLEPEDDGTHKSAKTHSEKKPIIQCQGEVTRETPVLLALLVQQAVTQKPSIA